MKEKRISIICKTLALVALITFAVTLAISSLAVYKSKSTGTGEFKVAGWKITLNDENITTNNTFNLSLKDALWNHRSDIAKENENDVVIAPGSVGTYDIEIDTKDSELDAVYEVSVVLKQNNSTIDISTINDQFNVGLFRDDVLKGDIARGVIEAGEKEHLTLKISWIIYDDEEANEQDIDIGSNSFGIEVSVVTKQKTNIEPVYPEGKSKTTVVPGDIVTIGTEEFYVVTPTDSVDGDLVLLAHYNLKVGEVNQTSGTNSFAFVKKYTSSDEGYGLQSSEVKGYDTNNTKHYGVTYFTNTHYWRGKVGTDYPGIGCTSKAGFSYPAGTECSYIYDENSNLYKYVENYKDYLESIGATIKEARLLGLSEAYEAVLGNSTWKVDDFIANAPAWIYETSYWLGSFDHYDTTDPEDYEWVWAILNYNDLLSFWYGYNKMLGVRPVIVI